MKVKLPLVHNIEERTMEDIKAYFRPEVFIEYCKACGHYGKIWTCPPYNFDIEEKLKDFRYIYIIGSKLNFGELEESLKLPESQEDVQKAVNDIYMAARAVMDERLINIEGKNKQLRILLAGRCLKCSHCTREQQLPCTYPEEAHFSLESLGFDVATICENILGHKIQWTKECLPEYLTLASAILSPEKLDICDIYDSLAY